MNKKGELVFCTSCKKETTKRFYDMGKGDEMYCEDCAVAEYKTYWGDHDRHCECNAQHAVYCYVPHSPFCPMSWS